MRKLQWRTEVRTVNELMPYEKNPRTISTKQIADLKKSLKQFNLVEIPAIDVDNRILAGHQRLKVMQLLGRGNEKIDVRVPNRKLTDEEYERYLIASNAITGDWDFDKLKSFDFDTLIDIGFDESELRDIWSQHLEVDEEFDVERELKEITDPITKQGDLIVLGKHRLINGDCTDPNVLKRLFGDERASMIYSDPPYNIKLDYNKGIGGKATYGGNVNDDRSYDEYYQFIRQSLEASLAVANKDTHVFYWSDQTYIGLIQDVYRSLGIQNKRVCLWIKNGQNPTPKVAFNKCYEPCTYGVRGKPYIATKVSQLNEVMNKEVGTGNQSLDDINDIWIEKRLSGKEYEHATSKPPKLHEKAIRRCTKPNDIILDSFSGSGSTLIAGEQLGRRVYAVELESRFCDLAIKRYEKLTGTKAIIHHGKET